MLIPVGGGGGDTGWEFAAYPPEVNIASLAGPGPGQLFAAAGAQAAMASALVTAATGTQGQVATLMTSWQGVTAQIAQQKFSGHRSWMLDMAEHYMATAAATTSMGSAYVAAVAAMAPVQATLTTVYTMRAHAAAMTAAAATAGAATAGVGAVALAGGAMATEAAAESLYLKAWNEAANNMKQYDSAASAGQNVPAPSTAPSIASGGGGASGAPFVTMDYLSGGGLSAVQGGGSQLSDMVGSAANSVSSVSSAGQSMASSAGQSASSAADQAASSGMDNAAQAASTAGQALPTMPGNPISAAHDPTSLTPQATDPAGGGSSTTLGGFPGTSSASPTLLGMYGVGSGSSVAMSMTRTGTNPVSSASSGYRTPKSWPSAQTTAAAESTTATAPVRTPPRGASAPESQQRRKRDEELHGEGTVIAPISDEDEEVPDLEQQPTVGVIEYAADDA